MSESLNLFGKAIRSFLGYSFCRRPIQAVYYLTYRCPSCCDYCDIWTRNAYVADPGEVVKNIGALKKLGVQFISFTGGEPLFYPHLAQVLKAAKAHDMRTTIITSGLSYSRKAQELRGLVDDLEFSLSTMRRKAYLKERGVDALLEVTRAIELAVSLGEPVSLLATVYEENISELPELIEFAQTLDVMCILGPVYEYFGNKPFPPQMAHLLRVLFRKPGVWMNKAFLEFMERGGNPANRPRCGALRTTLAISPGGRLLVPCFHHVVETYPITGDLQRLYHSREISAERKKVGRWSFCQGCHIFCYFEGAFLRSPDRLFFLDLSSRIRWFVMNRKLEQRRGIRQP